MKVWEVEMERIFVCLVHLSRLILSGVMLGSGLVWSLIFRWPGVGWSHASVPALGLV